MEMYMNSVIAISHAHKYRVNRMAVIKLQTVLCKRKFKFKWMARLISIELD